MREKFLYDWKEYEKTSDLRITKRITKPRKKRKHSNHSDSNTQIIQKVILKHNNNCFQTK